MELMSDSELQSNTDDLFSTYNLDGLEDTPIVPFVGLRNLGNSCFFNSVLQILFYCPGFQKRLAVVAQKVNFEKEKEDNNSKHETKDKLKLLPELHKLFVAMKKNQGFLANEESLEYERENAKAIRPDDLMCNLRKIYPAFEPYTQQDAQECLRCILGVLDDATMHINGKKNELSSTLVLEETNCKLIGGRKLGPTSVSSENSRENQDPTRTTVKQESRTTASRKKNMRSLLRKPFKVKSVCSNNTEICQRPGQKEGPLHPLLENTNFLNDADPGCSDKSGKKHAVLNKTEKSNGQSKDSVTLLHTPTKRPNQCDISSLSPPAKRKKLSLCNGIRSFYKPFTSRLPFEKKKSYNISKPEATFRKNPFKVLSKTNNSGDYEKLMEKSTEAKFGIVAKKVESMKEEFCPNENDNSCSIDTENPGGVNFVEDLFQGKLVNETRCMECESCVYRDEPFMDVSLPVRRNFTTECSKEKSPEQVNKVDSDDEDDDETNCSVVWGLSAFTSHEILKGDNKYYCGKCRRYVEGARRLQFHSIPPILTFHLKRFTTAKPLGGGDSFSTTVSKINSCLNVPLELCLDQWCAKTCAKRKSKYKLFGIIIHSGITISSGHYLAYVKLEKSLIEQEYDNNTGEKLKAFDGNWIEADDECTKVITEKELYDVISPQSIQGVSRTPYLLFYRRENM